MLLPTLSSLPTCPPPLLLRYARTDEIGVPFAITIDYQTLEDSTATLRERDSTAQVGGVEDAGGHGCCAARPGHRLQRSRANTSPCPPESHLMPSCPQVRVPVAELPGLVRRLTDMEISWADVAAQYPAQAPASED